MSAAVVATPVSARLTIREATSAARSLERFTRKEFAEAIGVSMLEAGKWLKRLKEERDCLRMDGRTYVYDDPDTRVEEVVEARYADQDARVIARRLKRFTAAELADAAGRSLTWASKEVKELIDREIIFDTGQVRWQPHGKSPAIYAEIPIAPTRRLERRDAPIDDLPRERRPARANGRGDGRTLIRRPVNKMFQPVFDAIYAQGGEITMGGKHYKVRMPSGDTWAMSVTPSDPNAHRAAERKARERGVRI